MDASAPLPAGDSAMLVRRIRIVLLLFIVGLVASGLTTFFLEPEVRFLASFVQDIAHEQPPGLWTELEAFVLRVQSAIEETAKNHPILFYGTDWLGFAHIVIAIAFVGPYRDPVRNKWVVDFGLLACAAVLPAAILAGEIRGIPWLWRAIDCSFGVFGAIPLFYLRCAIRRLEILAARQDPVRK